MFLITTAYQKARSVRRPDKLGRVVFRIAQKTGNNAEWSVRAVSSDILGDRETVVEANRAEIIQNIRVIYAIIEKHANQSEPFSIDEVAEDFRLALKGDARMKAVIERAEQEFPLRADLVSVGNEYKRDFRFVYPGSPQKSDNLLEYISVLAQQAKNERKSTRFRSYSSTRASLERYFDGSDISLKNIDRAFLSNYSNWLKYTGVTDSTQSFYLRTLRSILNRAKEDGLTDTAEDLFIGLNTRVVFKEAHENQGQDYLTRDILKKISGVELSGDSEVGIVRDMFMFGFYCRGMELIDVISLTKSSVDGNKLIYRRRSNGHPKTITLDKSAREIVSKYQTTDGEYLFPLSEIYRGLQQYSVTNIVRRNIKRLGNAIGFPQLTFSMNITTWQHLMDELSVSDIVLGSA